MNTACKTCRHLSDNRAFCLMYELLKREARDLCQGTYHQRAEDSND